MKKKKEEGNVLVFHVFIHLSVYSSVHPSVRPLCLIVFGGRERERETCAYCRAVAGSIQWLLYLSFICSGLHYYCYSTVYTHTHTPPFFFRSFFFCWCAWRMLFTSRYIIAISSFLPFHSPFFFFFLFISFYLFICLFIFFIRGASFHFVVRRDLALARTQTSQSTNKSNSTSECNVITCVFYSTEEGEKEEDERHNNNEKMGNCRCRCC